MTTELRARNNAAQLYVQALTAAWRSGVEVHEPSVWRTRDPEIEEKMLRDADIAHAVGFRRHLIAGKRWNLQPKVETERAPMAVMVGTALIEEIAHFSEARIGLARAFFSGARFARVHGSPRILTLGDGVPRTWWVPNRIEDMDKRAFRVMSDVVGTGDARQLRAHWERWDVARGEFVPETARDALQTIRHVYQDDQGTLGHGRALREALGWWWYAKTEIFGETLAAIERFAQGVVTAKVSGVRDAETGLPNTELIRQWRDILEDLRARHVLVYDANDTVEVMSPSSEGWQLMADVRKELRTTIYTLVLGANLTTAADSGGSYALAEIQENSTAALVEYDRSALEETLTDDLLGCVWAMNRRNLAELRIANQRPVFNIAQEKMQNPTERIAVAEGLSRIGVELALEDVLDQTGFRVPEGDEPRIKPPTTPAAPTPGGFDLSRLGL